MNRSNKPVHRPAAKFSVYHGLFSCQKCKADVDNARLWKDTLDLTWMCTCKYISKVKLDVKGY